MGSGREGVRESNEGVELTKVYLQQGYTEKPLSTMTLELIMKKRTVK
jgi:hypothetical protein